MERVSLLTIAVFGALVLSIPAKADTLNFTLSSPQQTGLPGTTLSFSGTVSTPSSNTGAVFLNDVGTFSSGFLVLNDTPFFLNSPHSMAPGQTNTFVVFTVGIPVGTPVGSYPGTFSILGGSSPAAFFSLSTASFQVNVSVPAGVPEPATMLLLSSGLVGVAAKVRKRRKAV